MCVCLSESTASKSARTILVIWWSMYVWLCERVCVLCVCVLHFNSKRTNGWNIERNPNKHQNGKLRTHIKGTKFFILFSSLGFHKKTGEQRTADEKKKRKCIENSTYRRFVFMCVCVRVRHYDVWERKRTDERLGYNFVVAVLFVMSSSENLIYFFLAGALGWDCILVPWSSVAGLSRNTLVADSTNESNKEKTRRSKRNCLTAWLQRQQFRPWWIASQQMKNLKKHNRHETYIDLMYEVVVMQTGHNIHQPSMQLISNLLCMNENAFKINNALTALTHDATPFGEAFNSSSCLLI